jgi:N-acetylmuramoyl-L-alanine amidase
MTVLAAICATCRAASPAHLNNVVYSDGVVTIQLSEPTSYKTTFWESSRRFIVDVEATGIDLRLSQLPLYAAAVSKVRWNQFSPDTVRVVLDLNTRARPTVLASVPTSVIAIRVAPSGSAAARPSLATSVSDIQQGTPAASRQAAQIGDIDVQRGSDGRPERLVVRTDKPTSAHASWWGNHLAVDLPDTAPSRERIVPVNDPVALRVRTGSYQSHGRVVVDMTQRVGYKLTTLDDGRGFAIDFTLPEPGDPAIIVDEPRDAPSGSGTLKGKLIVLDAGHGGHDQGARSQWVKEKDANLDIVLRMRNVLEARGARVELTRSDDTFIALRDRPALAMRLKADAFVSIHCNSSARPTSHGTEVFYRRNTAESKRLAKCLYDAHREQTGLPGRGVKSDSSAPQGGLAVLKYTSVPCALMEVAFVNWPDEGKKLASPDWRQTAAEGFTKGLERFFEGRN